MADVLRNDSSVYVRMAAVERIDDEVVLADAARNDSYVPVRRLAVERIADEDVLIDVAMNDCESEVRRIAVKKIGGWNVLADILRNESNGDIDLSHGDVLADAARNDPDRDVRIDAVKRIYDEDVLIDVARNDFDRDVRMAAVERIDDEAVLAEFARNSYYDVGGKEALLGISDDDILADIARNCLDVNLREYAVEMIHDENILLEFLRNDSDMMIRERALKNINDADTLQKLVLENFGYFACDSYSAFKRNYNKLIYEFIGPDVYADVLDKLSDESVLIDLVHEKLFSDFRVLVVRRLTSPDVLRNLALNDSDYHVRMEAVKNPNLSDNKTFVEIMQSDYNDAVRFEALRRIEEGDMLEDAINDLNPLIRLYAFGRLENDFALNRNDVSLKEIDLSSIETIEDENALYSIANSSIPASVRRHAFEKINDEYLLANIACCNGELANIALNRITDKLLLLNVALYGMDFSVRRKAVKKIDDEEFLLKVVQNNPWNGISEYIVDRIRDESLLEIIASNNSNPYIRKAAVNSIQSQDILTRLGEIESDELVCIAIARKTQNKGLLEYMGISNPCKTVRRYVESRINDDDELLYRLAQKEYEHDNKRDMMSKMTNEEYVVNLLKRETWYKVFHVDYKITNSDLLIDLAKNSVLSSEAKQYALKHIQDKSILKEFIYASPFCSKKPKCKSLWEGIRYSDYDLMLCISILRRLDFNDMDLIADFLIENNFPPYCSISRIADKVTEIPSIYRIVLNCKSNEVRRLFKPKLEYVIRHVNEGHDYDFEDESDAQDRAIRALGALFG